MSATSSAGMCNSPIPHRALSARGGHRTVERALNREADIICLFLSKDIERRTECNCWKMSFATFFFNIFMWSKVTMLPVEETRVSITDETLSMIR